MQTLGNFHRNDSVSGGLVGEDTQKHGGGGLSRVVRHGRRSKKRIKTKLKFVTGWQCFLRVDAWLRLDGAHIQAKTGGESTILLLERKVLS